jgi:HPt (histidine-containing phosphotransfer) domain-containing protein
MSVVVELDSKAWEKLEKTGGPQLIRELIDIYLQYIPGKLAEARAGLQADKLEDVQWAAHPIKSSSNNLGITIMRVLAEKIENLAMEKQNAATIAPLLAELEDAFARTKLLLETKRRELG